MKWGIRHQVLLLTLLPTLTVSILLGGYFTTTRLQDLKSAFLKRGETLALQLEPSGEYGIFSRNKLLLQDLANEIFTDDDVQSVSFYTAGGNSIITVGKSTFKLKTPTETPLHALNKVLIQEDKQAAAFTMPVVTYKETDSYTDSSQLEQLVGWLKVELDASTLHSNETKLLIHASLIFLLGVGMSILLAFKMGRNVTQPILELSQSVENIKKGKLDQPVVLPRFEELKKLAVGVNTMSSALKEANSAMQQKVEQATLSLRRTLETIEVQNVELEMARKSAETANKVKSEFLADMSHEIRTPLNGVIGFINLLQKTELDEKQKEYTNTVHKSANNLLAIINDILDFSKIEAGKLRIELTPMDIRECVEETLNLLAPYAREKNIVLAPFYYPDVPKAFLGDPLRIKQVITNLVNNAIKFTEKGSVIVRVMLESKSTPPSIRISVTDTGIGLSSEDQKTLFQAFNQVKIGTPRKFGGTGLGLVICKKLVEQMGGSIGVESELNKGSTFWFTFQIQENSLVQSMYPPTHPKTKPQTKRFTRPFQILAVDDNPDNLKLIQVLLGDMGAKVMTKSSGQEAIEIVQIKHFDLILMDIRMSNINGIEAAQAIRKYERETQKKKVPIIALTAHALESEKAALLSAGIDDYLAKPVGELELRDMVEKWTKNDTEVAVIDWELGQKLAGGNLSLAKELFSKLLNSLPQDKAQINEDFKMKDWKALRDHVHKLHGACCYCGVPELKRCAKELEAAAAENKVDEIPARLNALNKAVDLILKEASLNQPS